METQQKRSERRPGLHILFPVIYVLILVIGLLVKNL
jgi:hypothetical protein